MYINTCKQCQDKFEVSRNSRKRKYCNRCLDKNKPDESKICKSCQKEFLTPSHHDRIKIFCSHSCAATYNNTKRSPIIKCKNCDTIITGRAKRANIFCSKKCCGDYKKKIKLDKFEKGELSSKSAKDILLENHGNICLNTTCAWDFTKKFVSVELEHIDGNSENNLPENLTLLCPNCHSLTSTYKAKNKGNGISIRMERYYSGKSY